jgi:hypothetical protein
MIVIDRKETPELNSRISNIAHGYRQPEDAAWTDTPNTRINATANASVTKGTAPTER